MKKIEKMECLERLGGIMKDHRLSMKLTQVEVAGRVGITQGYYCSIEKGQKDADLATVITICRVLKIDLNAFVASYI